MSEDLTVDIKVLSERFLPDGSAEILCSINDDTFYVLVDPYNPHGTTD